MPMDFPLCMQCRYFRFLPGRPCDAFPEGVPDDIWEGRITHNHSTPGDHDLRFVLATRDEFNARLHAAADERERREQLEGEMCR